MLEVLLGAIVGGAISVFSIWVQRRWTLNDAMRVQRRARLEELRNRYESWSNDNMQILYKIQIWIKGQDPTIAGEVSMELRDYLNKASSVGQAVYEIGDEFLTKRLFEIGKILGEYSEVFKQQDLTELSEVINSFVKIDGNIRRRFRELLESI